MLFLIQMTTKYVIAQDILSHEALFRISKLLDQFKDGLKKTHALKLILAFLELFQELFTYCGRVTADEVLDAVYVNEPEMLPADSITMAFLQKYIRSSSEEGIIPFPCYFTFTV